ncbi:MAG: aldehyde dehydrogenase [Salinivirgaceae bacterium]|nr:aldehyde dehydrogenase [Salinivirgaceae bacterium]
MKRDKSIFINKRTFFDSGATKSYDFRIEQLKIFKKAITQNESKILDALYKDFKKPRFEAFTSEVGFLYEEINFAIKHLKKWMKPDKVATPLVLELSKSKIVKEPLGVILIIGPWNYPFQLLLSPLVGAIAAGNCSVIKPSNETPHVAKIVEEIINQTFDSNYISVVQGPGRTVGNALIEEFNWNHIFFTGSPQVGKQVAKMAANHLSPVTLELGGKSPAIIDENVDIDIAAKRVVFGKFFNAGQTCVCPDYVLVHESKKQEFILKAKKYIQEFYGDNPLVSKDLTHIVNSKRFNVLSNYLNDGKIVHGGKFDEENKVIEPTLLDDITFDMKVMQEEIFGPILPILTWNTKEDLIDKVRKNRYPLACYIFTENKSFKKFIINRIEFGGGSVNNTLVHLVNPKLPFGGVGNSGMGNYHGKYSFETFSHKKSILESPTKLDLPLRYPPYSDKKMKIGKWFFK